MLQRMPVALSLRQGLDTKSDPKQVVPGRLLILENGVLTKLGAIQKRSGYAPLSQNLVGGGTLASARLLSTFKEQLFLGTGLAGYSYAQAQAGWAAKGSCEGLRVSSTPVVRNVYQQSSQDATLHPAGLTLAAWEDSSGGVRYSVIDTATGQSIVPNALASATASRPKCASLGAYLILVFAEAGLGKLRYVAFPVASPQTPLAAADIAANLNANGAYDATVGGGRLFLAYANTAGGATQLSLRYVTTLLAGSNELQLSAAALPTGVTVFVDPNLNVWAGRTAPRCGQPRRT